MDKGQITRSRILDNAMDYVCQFGLVSISIGEIAKRLKMSRTGVISHFKNKSDMQIAILRHCEDVFIKQVLKPSFSPDPVTHLEKHFNNWINWVYKLKNKRQMTCPFVKAVAEFQDRPECDVKVIIREQQQRTLEYLGSLVQRCIDLGAFKSDTDISRFTLDSYGFYMAHNVSKHLLKDGNADRIFNLQITTLIEQSLKPGDAS